MHPPPPPPFLPSECLTYPLILHWFKGFPQEYGAEQQNILGLSEPGAAGVVMERHSEAGILSSCAALPRRVYPWTIGLSYRDEAWQRDRPARDWRGSKYTQWHRNTQGGLMCTGRKQSVWCLSFSARDAEEREGEEGGGRQEHVNLWPHFDVTVPLRSHTHRGEVCEPWQTMLII